jgi:hypothetical protein
MTFAHVRAIGSPVIPGAVRHAHLQAIDSNLSAGLRAVRQFCEGSTK